MMKPIIAILLLMAINFTAAFGQTPPQKKFIAIADIHFNPLIGCSQFSVPCPILSELQTADPKSWDIIFNKYAAKIKTSYHQDTDYHLLTSTLTELSTLSQRDKPSFILILGDFLAHQFPEQYVKFSGDQSHADYQIFTKKTLEYLTYKLNQASPQIDLYPVLGNNDSYNGNYKIEPHGLFLKDTAGIFSTLIKNKKLRAEFTNEYSNAGYYAITLNQKNQRLIVLNSVLFSTLFPVSTKQKAANEQLAWLQNQLNTAKQQQQHVLLASHIPAGTDVYLAAKMRFDIVRYFFHPLFWQATYNQQFISLLRSYPTVLVGMISGHIHADSFQLISDKSHEIIIPNSISPSISPIYGNNPGFKVFSYNDQTFQLINFKTLFYPLNEPSAIWQEEYDFNNIYQSSCKRCLLVTGMLNLKQNNVLMSSYKKYYAAGRNTQPINTQRDSTILYWCGIYNMDWESYRACTTST